VEDWYSVSVPEIVAAGFPKKVKRTKLLRLLKAKCPEHRWDETAFLNGRFVQLKRLERCIASLFEGEELRKSVDAAAGQQTERPLELRFYLPSLNLAFEYQNSELEPDSKAEEIFDREEKKKNPARQKGVTLIRVPFWWDTKQESLVATIKEARPELLQHVKVGAPPIPARMPSQFFGQLKKNVPAKPLTLFEEGFVLPQVHKKGKQ